MLSIFNKYWLSNESATRWTIFHAIALAPRAGNDRSLPTRIGAPLVFLERSEEPLAFFRSRPPKLVEKLKRHRASHGKLIFRRARGASCPRKGLRPTVSFKCPSIEDLFRLSCGPG